ncbi:MAG: PD40 domain-containing protein [Saprospiraceae bacterium]|uniref:PD40 domain-containing protein n=1 Tax=Candidatus Opimibacter skivensis TaxID=2982028 RepID=A0A9D7SZ41_9BACT|nr:PD40 domain-containing protein [Candidatus Opimibacter skivensis]
MIKLTPKIPVLSLITLFMCITCPSFLFGQSSGSNLKDKADTYFDAGDYRSALKLYRMAGTDHSTNKKELLRVGICQYEINDVDSAIKSFQTILDQGKTKADVFLYMAKAYQAKNMFHEAIPFYKSFIENSKPDAPLIAWAKDELTRCANGARLKFAEEEAYIENAGTSINTQYAEFGVKNSPTKIDKIYFNSNRTNNTSLQSTNYNVDIYSASLVNGKWETPESLPSSINSVSYDQVCGFSNDGQILYFLSPVRNEFKIIADTFSGQEGVAYQGIFNGPYHADGGGTDLTFFNDSICLFSSDMAGGYGGYDLYISILHKGVWSRAANLGPTINSFYNERSPFLTKNGQTLFFSSDNLESVGGLDIFRAVFDPDKMSWSLPENMGIPFNSSQDDTEMVLTSDGMTGYMTSNRKSGYGDKDLYRIFFKQPVLANQEISFVPTFYQLFLLRGIEASDSEQPGRPVEVKEYFISHLFVDDNVGILAPQNIKKLDILANLLLIYPHINAELSGFEIPVGQPTFNLYFSIKKTEEAADYLVRKGVQRNRLILKGYGSSFPLVVNMANNANSPVYLKLNHRIEIGLHHFENEPVITHLENIPVSDNLRDPAGVKFSSLRHEMYYSVQLTSINQILQNPILESTPEMFIEVDNAQGNYMYMSGMLPTYKEAEQKLNKMISAGFTDAFIVPYVDGLRISHDEIPGYSTEYPDLLNYQAKSKK